MSTLDEMIAARREERDRIVREIEITPAMLRAGGREFLRDGDYGWAEKVADIYRAMENARRNAAKAE